MIDIKKVIKKIRSNRLLMALVIFLFLVIIFFVLVISGRQNCERVHINEGVTQTCDCRGIEVDVKSTVLSAERLTICLGSVNNRVYYQK